MNGRARRRPPHSEPIDGDAVVMVRPYVLVPPPPRPVCGAVRPVKLQTPPLGASRLPCAETAGHEPPHRDALGHRWIATPQLVQALAVTVTAEQLRQTLSVGSAGVGTAGGQAGDVSRRSRWC